MDDFIKDTRTALAEYIKVITRKGGHMSPPEIEILTKAVCTLEALKRLENGSEGYSETSGDSSYRVGRNQTTGRFMSRDGGSSGSYHDNGNSSRYYDGNSNNTGYSGHSIHDRIVDTLERMMNETQGEYERQQIRDFIKKAREN